MLRQLSIKPSPQAGGVGKLSLAACVLVLLLSNPMNTAYSEPEGNGTVVRETLANGLRVVMVRDTLAPVVTTVMNYEVGSNEAPRRDFRAWPTPRNT